MIPLPPGTELDRFEVVRLLGEGGLARVFLVRHRTLGSLHALKLLSVTHSTMRQRFLTEGQVQARLRHPHVVPVTDVVHLQDEVGLVMEFVEGPTLEQLLADGGSLTAAEVARLFHEICAGVAAAHAQGVLHRDLKPGNVLLAVHDDGAAGTVTAKVADFGIAKVAGDMRRALGRGAPPTAQGAMMGTPGYMAPEQQTDAAGVDARADVYSLGCILYELLTGVAPFRRKDPASSLQASLSGAHVPLGRRVPDAPPALVAAVERAIAREREARWGSVAELDREAAAALAGMSGRFPRPQGVGPGAPSPTPPPAPPRDAAPRPPERPHAGPPRVEPPRPGLEARRGPPPPPAPPPAGLAGARATVTPAEPPPGRGPRGGSPPPPPATATWAQGPSTLGGGGLAASTLSAAGPAPRANRGAPAGPRDGFLSAPTALPEHTRPRPAEGFLSAPTALPETTRPRPAGGFLSAPTALPESTRPRPSDDFLAPPGGPAAPPRAPREDTRPEPLGPSPTCAPELTNPRPAPRPLNPERRAPPAARTVKLPEGGARPAPRGPDWVPDYTDPQPNPDYAAALARRASAPAPARTPAPSPAAAPDPRPPAASATAVPVPGPQTLYENAATRISERSLAARARAALDDSITELSSGRGGDLPPFRSREPTPAGDLPPAWQTADAAAAPAEPWVHATVVHPKPPAAPPAPAVTRHAPIAFGRRSRPWGSWLAAGALAGGLLVAGFAAWVNTNAADMARASEAVREGAPDLEPLLGHPSEGLRRAWAGLRTTPEGEAAVAAFLGARTPATRLTEGRRLNAALRARVGDEARRAQGAEAQAAARSVLTEIDAADAALERFAATLTRAETAWDTSAAPLALALGWVEPTAAPTSMRFEPLEAPSVAVADPPPPTRRRR